MIVLVMGGQFGSEGKGEVCSWLAATETFDLIIRLASPNSGHTFTYNSVSYIMRQLPATWKSQDTTIYLPSGSIINSEVLESERNLLLSNNYKSDIVISPYATLVNRNDIGTSMCSTGTTREGVGETRAKRSLRQAVQIGGYESKKINKILGNPDSKILVESSQGYGLSLHSHFYPFVTSIDINPYQILSDSDIPYGIHKVKIYMVIRTFPIRIAGNSGVLEEEISWEDIGIVPELTSVTKLERRIGLFDCKQVSEAASRCRPDKLILTHLDYIPAKNRENFLKEIETKLSRVVDFVGLAPGKIIRRK